MDAATKLLATTAGPAVVIFLDAHAPAAAPVTAFADVNSGQVIYVDPSLPVYMDCRAPSIAGDQQKAYGAVRNTCPLQIKRLAPLLPPLHLPHICCPASPAPPPPTHTHTPAAQVLAQVEGTMEDAVVAGDGKRFRQAICRETRRGDGL